MKIWFEQQETEINEQNFPEQDLEKLKEFLLSEIRK